MGLPSEDRKKALKGRGFQCKCSLCSATPGQIKQSDANRKRIAAIRDALQSEERMGLTKFKQLSSEVLSLIEKEGLSLQLGEFYEVFSSRYFRFGNVEKAKHYALLAWKHIGALEGHDDDFDGKVRQYIRDLDRFSVPRR